MSVPNPLDVVFQFLKKFPVVYKRQAERIVAAVETFKKKKRVKDPREYRRRRFAIIRKQFYAEFAKEGLWKEVSGKPLPWPDFKLERFLHASQLSTELCDCGTFLAANFGVRNGDQSDEVSFQNEASRLTKRISDRWVNDFRYPCESGEACQSFVNMDLASWLYHEFPQPNASFFFGLPTTRNKFASPFGTDKRSMTENRSYSRILVDSFDSIEVVVRLFELAAFYGQSSVTESFAIRFFELACSAEPVLCTEIPGTFHLIAEMKETILSNGGGASYQRWRDCVLPYV